MLLPSRPPHEPSASSKFPACYRAKLVIFANPRDAVFVHRGPRSPRRWHLETARQASGSGRGMNSVSPGTVSNLAIFQSALACSMRSLLEDTKFHQMCRGPSIGSPPSAINRASVFALMVMRSPGRKTRSCAGPKISPAISTSPATV